MAVRTLADGNQALYILDAAPAASTGIPTIAELLAGINASSEVQKAGTFLRATASDTINEAAFNESGNAVNYGAGNAEGAIVPFLWFDPDTGKYSASDSGVFEALATKGTSIWAYIVEGVKKGSDAVGGETFYGGGWTTDEPQPGPMGEYLKRTVPLGSDGTWVAGKLPSA